MVSKFPVLVERRLRMKRPSSGKKSDIVIRIGHPKVINSEGDADCPVAIDGLFDELPPMRGIDAMDSLRLAIRFAERLLQDRSDGAKFYWPNGEEYFAPDTPHDGR